MVVTRVVDRWLLPPALPSPESAVGPTAAVVLWHRGGASASGGGGLTFVATAQISQSRSRCFRRCSQRCCSGHWPAWRCLGPRLWVAGFRWQDGSRTCSTEHWLAPLRVPLHSALLRCSPQGRAKSWQRRPSPQPVAEISDTALTATVSVLRGFGRWSEAVRTFFPLSSRRSPSRTGGRSARARLPRYLAMDPSSLLRAGSRGSALVSHVPRAASPRDGSGRGQRPASRREPFVCKGLDRDA